MITKEEIDRLEFHAPESKALDTKPRTRPEPYLHETILELIAEWRERQEPVEEPEYQDPLCRHCGKDEGHHWWPHNTCNQSPEPGERWYQFEPLSSQ